MHKTQSDQVGTTKTEITETPGPSPVILPWPWPLARERPRGRPTLASNSHKKEPAARSFQTDHPPAARTESDNLPAAFKFICHGTATPVARGSLEQRPLRRSTLIALDIGRSETADRGPRQQLNTGPTGAWGWRQTARMDGGAPGATGKH
eukprot:13876471-Alexandrium_andersonii.AAC.1